MPKISVITINYNDKYGLTKTIESVIGQTSVDYEFLVIDGNSDDGSKDVIRKYAAHLDFSVSEPDNGIYHAMNKGIRQAKGEFLLFLNSGDRLYDNDVLKNVQSELSDEFGIYYGDIIVKKPHSERYKKYPGKLSFSFFYTNALCHQSSFIKRSLFYDYFFYNENYKIYSDGEFFMYAICKQNVPYKHLDLIVSVYDFSGISSKPEYEKLHEQERLASISTFFPMFAEDYLVYNRLNSKRIKQIFYIEKFPVAWKVVKAFLNVILFFLPKPKK